MPSSSTGSRGDPFGRRARMASAQEISPAPGEPAIYSGAQLRGAGGSKCSRSRRASGGSGRVENRLADISEEIAATAPNPQANVAELMDRTHNRSESTRGHHIDAFCCYFVTDGAALASGPPSARLAAAVPCLQPTPCAPQSMRNEPGVVSVRNVCAVERRWLSSG